MIEEFERHLRGTNLSENTISSYLFAIRQYSSQYDGITKKNLRAYKIWLIENYKPKTVNLRLRAINCYLESIGKESWKMPFVRVQQKAFLENVISEADYEYFKNCLKRDDELFWYFVIRFLAATGARVSELIQIKVEHIKLGHLDLYSKGGKLRRIYIPKALQNEALSWLNDKHQESGFIFLNKYGDRITTRGISGQLKKLAVRYGIDPVVIYPHSFRHRFAKSFLERCNDIAFLADLTPTRAICSFSDFTVKATSRRKRFPTTGRKQCTMRKEPMKPLSLWKSGRQCRQKLNGELSSTNRSRPHSRLSFTLVAFSVQNAGRTSAGKQRQHGWFGSVPRSTPKGKSTALPSRYRRPPLTSWCDRSRMTLSASKKSLPMTTTPCTFTFQTAQWSHAPGQTVHELKAGRRK